MNKTITLLLLFISLNLFATTPNDILSFIERPYPMIPLIIIDKSSWNELSALEKEAFHTQMLNEIAKSGGAANGGYAVKCDNQKLMLLDFFEATLPTLGKKTKKIQTVPGSTFEYFSNIFRYFPHFYKEFQRAYSLVGQTDHWVVSNIKNSYDTNSGYKLSSGRCRNGELVQVALQQNQTVYVNSKAFNQLSELQKELLAIHETLYYMGIHFNNLKTSDIIREIIRIAITNSFSDPKTKMILLERIRSSLQQLIGQGFQTSYDPHHITQSQMKSLENATNLNLDISGLANKKYSCQIQTTKFTSYFFIEVHTDHIMHFSFEKSPFGSSSSRIFGSTLHKIFPYKLRTHIGAEDGIAVTISKIPSEQLIIEFKLNNNTPSIQQRLSVRGFCTISDPHKS